MTSTIVTNNSVSAINNALLSLSKDISEETQQTLATKRLELLTEEEKELLNPIDAAMYQFKDAQYIEQYGYDKYHNYTCPDTIQVSQSWFTFGELMVIYGTVVDTYKGKPVLPLSDYTNNDDITFHRVVCDAVQNFTGHVTSILTPNISLGQKQQTLLYRNPPRYENDYLYLPVAQYSKPANTNPYMSGYTASANSTIYCYSFALLGKVSK